MKKLFGKNIGLVMVIESVAIVVAVFMGVMAYRMEWEREQTAYGAYKEDVLDWEFSWNKPGQEPDIFSIFEWLNDSRAWKPYGVAMRLMGRSGETIAQTTVMNQILAWNPKGGWDDNELLQLDPYFSEDAIDRMVSFYFDSGDGGEMRYVQKMLGYYDGEGGFIPVGIIFRKESESVMGEAEAVNEEAYTMVNEEAKAGIDPNRLFWRINTKYAENEQRLSTDEQGNEYGTIHESFNATKRIFDEKASAKLDTDEVMNGATVQRGVDTYEMMMKVYNDSSSIQSYRVSFYADIDSIVLHSGDFHKDVLIIAAFCQLVGIAVAVCVIFAKKHGLILQYMRNTFINAMAHEMKTPISVMKNSVECIREGIRPEKQPHYIGLIDKEADHISEILDAMLVYTRVVDDGYRMKKERVLMSDIGRKVWEHYKPAIGEKGIRFEFDNRESFWVKGDSALLEMVVDNLFSNAVRHCPPEGTIRLAISRNALFMFNTGEHIPDVEMDKIWEPLYLVDAARSDKGGSSGMGLAISAQILKLHRVKYGVRNVQGGVEFHIGV